MRKLQALLQLFDIGGRKRLFYDSYKILNPIVRRLWRTDNLAKLADDKFDGRRFDTCTGSRNRNCGRSLYFAGLISEAIDGS
ncbi:hypothetical protein DTL21_00765 [Bremerella cremea]|uniref:Uncharacterized protein n=1 Tax=Blastopirellula marina TaxID=124 RepID=A0A2S8G7R5_9BACT|nr:hypothetical protein C5Y83_00765 [Blastopirellula marina]RCS52080.1 hypothetical protein DTL21_00765 [Bremerella cremea]